MIDEQLIQLTRETATELESHCAEKALSYAGEQKDLDPVCKQVAKRLAPTWSPAASVGPFAFGDKLGWVGLGLVDLVFRWPDRLPTFLELKCGSDENCLAFCVWDAVKLATGVLAGNAEAGYLLAGAPLAQWQRPILGTQLFDSRAWRTSSPEIRGDYSRWWWKWQTERKKGLPNFHIPGRVAATFDTKKLGSFPFQIAGTPWELRLARVEPAPGDWEHWQPLTSPNG